MGEPVVTRRQWILTEPNQPPRCWWCGTDAQYRRYHDEEWGLPTADDRYIFEKICLEGFQAGLSWLTILRKRENFRAAFHRFEIHRVARMTGGDVARLLRDEGIVRHRGKIESTINNAKRAIELAREAGSLAVFVWSFAPVQAASARPKRGDRIAPKTPESIALSKALRKRGWSFVGPTTMYAFMQAVGIVNDHIAGCTAGDKVENLRSRFERPTM